MDKRTVLFLALAALAGCAGPPIIADLEDDKVFIQQRLGNMQTVEAEATKACAIHNRQPRGPLSQTCMDEYCMTKRYLFACMATR